MNDTRDKKFLRELAKSVHSELHSRRLGFPLRLKRIPKIRTTNSSGWAATIATFSGYKCRAELWLDRFTSHPIRKVYYCLYAFEKDGLAKLAQASRKEFGPHLSINLKDWDQQSDDCRLSKKLAKSRFGHPLYERYPENNEFFYGICEIDKTGLQRNIFTRLSARATDFFQTIVESVSKQTIRSDEDPYSAVENRRFVTRHLHRERKSYAATLRKQQDNYICQICKFSFIKSYGILGNDFAEAHHKLPLSSNSKLRKTSIDDLITVCANCHRMLHRMDGIPKDIDNLNKIVKNRKWR